jgi:predicted transcriptional regulator
MGLLEISITEDEKKAVIKVIKKFKNKQISISKIAKEAKGNTNRVRYVVEQLIAEERIVKIQTKNYNNNYRRYKYDINSVSNSK